MKWKNIKFWCWAEIEIPSTTIPPGPQAVKPADFRKCPQGPVAESTFCFDLLSYRAAFELNAIPTCILSVAIGRRADDVTVASNIHYYIDDLQLQLPARVWCQAQSLDNSTDSDISEWPEGKFKIFDGYVTGSGFRVSGQGAELTLSLTHWLADLNFSSALSKQSHPLNPTQLFYPPNYTVDNNMSGGGILPQPLYTSNQLPMQFFTSTTAQRDFWGGINLPGGAPNGLKDWLRSLTRTSRINASQITNLSSTQASKLLPAQNWEACRALSRFEPSAKLPDRDESGYILGVPLKLDSYGFLDVNLGNALATSIGTDSLETYSNVTLWDKLVSQFHADYKFSIVPLIDKALVVPFIPGLSSGDSDDIIHRVLRASDYENIDLQTIIPRPLRAVGVTIAYMPQAGANISKEAPIRLTSFGGWFDKLTAQNDPELNPVSWATPADPRYKEGLVMFVSSPRWLSNSVLPYLSTGGSTGVNAPNIGSSVTPNAGIPNQTASPRKVVDRMRSVWNSFARTLYIEEVLKNRQGLINGPVRFDIAPGSTIRVEVAQDKFVRNIVFPGSLIDPDDICELQYYKFVWCSVLRVETIIDCQNMQASTSFYVAYVRNRQENKDSATATARHPLWKSCAWGGCVLIEDPAFGQQTTYLCDE